jgi:hypothetical protein
VTRFTSSEARIAVMIVEFEVEDCLEVLMFPLLRHIGQTSRYEIPPRPISLREPLGADATEPQGLLATAWRCVDAFWHHRFLVMSRSRSKTSPGSASGRANRLRAGSATAARALPAKEQMRLATGPDLNS